MPGFAAIARVFRFVTRPLMLLSCVFALFAAGQVAAFDIGQDARIGVAAGAQAAVMADSGVQADTPEAATADDDATGKAVHCGACCLHHLVGHEDTGPELGDAQPRRSAVRPGEVAALRPITTGRLPEPPRA